MSELEPTRTYSNPTANDILRRMLDERGVEWSATTGAAGTIWTHWDAFNGYRVHAMDNGDGTVEIFGEWDVIPEQAIAATLGTGTCKVDVLNTGDCAGYECSEYIMHCNGCGHEFGHVLYNEDGDVWMSEPPNYCPICGRRIEQ